MHILPSQRFHRTDKRTWSLLDQNGALLGTLVKQKWSVVKREIIVDGRLYHAKGLKRWSSDQALFLGDVPVLVADFAWDRIRVGLPNNGGTTFIIRRKHFFSSEYHVADVDGTVRARIETRINWSDLDREPELIGSEGGPLDPMILLFAVHVINVQQQRTAGFAAGA